MVNGKNVNKIFFRKEQANVGIYTKISWARSQNFPKFYHNEKENQKLIHFIFFVQQIGFLLVL